MCLKHSGCHPGGSQRPEHCIQDAWGELRKEEEKKREGAFVFMKMLLGLQMIQIITLIISVVVLRRFCHLLKCRRHTETHSDEEKVCDCGCGWEGPYIIYFQACSHISQWFLFHQSEQKDWILYEGADENIVPNKLVCGCFLSWPACASA